MRKMKQFKWVIPVLAILFSISTSFAQTHTVSGRVTDQDGKAVSGVNVTLKKGKTGTTTDANGHFMFSENESKNRSFGLGCEANGEFYHITNLSRDAIKHYDIHLK